MQKYDVTGMSCAACSARVEKVVRNVDGVTDVAVNLLTNSMNVEGHADSGAIIAAVTEAGYGASLKEDGQGGQAQSVCSRRWQICRKKERILQNFSK